MTQYNSRAVGLAWLGLLVASVFWAGNALVARAFHDAIPPFTLAFWRWTLALAILLPFVARPMWEHRSALRCAGWRLLVVAALGISTYSVLLYFAARTTVAINLTLLNTCLPLATFIGAGVLLNEWPPRRAWLGMAVATSGLLVLIAQGRLAQLAALSFNPGDLIMLLAVVDWALYTLLLRRWNHYFKLPPLVLLGALVASGVPMLLPFYLLELASGQRFELSVENFAAIGYTGVCASLLAYLLWNQGIRILGVAKAVLTNYLMPVFTALLGYLLLGEGLQAYHWLGGAMIFSGLLLATRPSLR
ncbi:DMT family transporter [Pseudomonas sp. JS3066]|jgi:drug/metabolite transporter (DMT)-like permease|uniref:DMT family transporter n=1 Tax=unclassified Pseudomonas TaxID=196821 RepID=UPI000EA86416|nr:MULTISPECIES: DMT family transporter [unclassified Pseudomonas]AYF90125.1 DMT family transporter [Pseudomonas sp. DY-1]MDH4656205.1 DMT family transporter [Pseudomonas sp. BN606]MRK20709.1 DMT family transporter [Pseudomonas sp. JG-B]WVK92296.1 DMT family transporter [Pseudomonas sp. JS3066]